MKNHWQCIHLITAICCSHIGLFDSSSCIVLHSCLGWLEQPLRSLIQPVFPVLLLLTYIIYQNVSQKRVVPLQVCVGVSLSFWSLVVPLCFAPSFFALVIVIAFQNGTAEWFIYVFCLNAAWFGFHIEYCTDNTGGITVLQLQNQTASAMMSEQPKF